MTEWAEIIENTPRKCDLCHDKRDTTATVLLPQRTASKLKGEYVLCDNCITALYSLMVPGATTRGKKWRRAVRPIPRYTDG